jgi:phosphoglycolate phosphatase
MACPVFAGVRAVLFDLDGTLADTAPDLAQAANQVRSARGLAPLPYSRLRPVASHGARGLLRVALDVGPDDPQYESVRAEFLRYYTERLCVESKLFDQIEPLLLALAGRGLPWGIVTNKIARLTSPIVHALALVPRAQTVVSGDTTAFAKPHPAPLLFAASAMHVAANSCLYVGDDRRDIEAGRAAGMRTVAAAYGYCADEDPGEWGADALIHAPLELLELID